MRPGAISWGAKKIPDRPDDWMNFFYGKIDEEHQDDNGADRFKGVELEPKKEFVVTRALI
jgi:hypothetical protein